MTSGKIMLRSKNESESYVQSKHPGITGHARRFAVNHYQKTFDWACSNCGKTGTILKVIGDFVRTSDCFCRSIRKKNNACAELFTQSNIPERYRNAECSKWINLGSDDKEKSINQSSFNVVQKYSSNIKSMLDRGYGLYLTGPNGVGKTYLASAVGNRAIKCGLTVMFFTMAEIIRIQIDGWFKEEVRSVVGRICSSDFLIVDDLDKIYRTKTGIESSVFDNLLRTRLQSNKPCVITSNRTIVDTQSDFGSSIKSMLVEHCAELVFVGSDYRSDLSGKIKSGILNDS